MGAVAFARDVVRRGAPYPKTRDGRQNGDG